MSSEKEFVWGGMTISPFDLRQQEGQFDIFLEIFENENSPSGSVTGSFKYNADLFDHTTIRRMADHFKMLLKGVIDDPAQKISEIPMLTQEELHKILVEFNDTKAEYPKDKCIHHLFEEQVKKTPDSVALVFEDIQMTYREFNKKANILAHYLISLGVGPEIFVCICMERSLEMVLAIYAIIKAGGAYVPIDPDYPEDRVKYMLEDSEGKIILAQKKFRELLSDVKSDIIFTDSSDNIFKEDKHSSNNPCIDIKSENAAYMIYTSGSTGKPKGVVNTHKGILNRLLWMQDAYMLNSEDVVLQKTPFSFDVSVWEFLWPLFTGASIVEAKPGGHMDPDYLAYLIWKEKITTLHFVPSMLSAFLDSADTKLCGSIKRVICSGEALSPDIQKRFFKKLNCELHNLYGPTEAAIDVSYWECNENNLYSSVPIGKPVANTQLYILDKNLVPVPVGVSGELHIGGYQVARGYHNRPNLTAEKFIPDIFSHEPNSRLYKTGDLAKWLPDGNIEFLGRIDFQVKIRGFRIELGEIESVLSAHPGVKENVVIAKESHAGDKQLAAYVVAEGLDIENQEQNVSDIRSFLKEKLPDYMIPSFFVFMDSLPLTPNGKIDRKKLPEPDISAMQKEYVAPRTDTEKKIASIWEEVLKLEQAGIFDNFFEIGGHSLLATVVISHLKETFALKLPIVKLFELPTISELAEYIDMISSMKDSGDLVSDNEEEIEF